MEEAGGRWKVEEHSEEKGEERKKTETNKHNGVT